MAKELTEALPEELPPIEWFGVLSLLSTLAAPFVCMLSGPATESLEWSRRDMVLGILLYAVPSVPVALGIVSLLRRMNGLAMLGILYAVCWFAISLFFWNVLSD